MPIPFTQRDPDAFYRAADFTQKNRLQDIYLQRDQEDRQATKARQAEADRRQSEKDAQEITDRERELLTTVHAPFARRALKSGNARQYYAQQLANPVTAAQLREEDIFELSDLDDPEFDSHVQAIAEWAPEESADPGPLETVVGDNGNPVLQPRSQAIGRTPYQKPESRPSSYEEFTLAQKDPEFATFLKSRRGRGISMTMPDGTQVQIGGAEGAIGPGELTAPTKNKLQESIVTATDQLDRLNSIGESFDPKYLTVQGKALGVGLKLKDIGGGMFGQMTPQERDYLRRYSTFRADSGKNLSAILNQLSGAAISPAEADRLKRGIPNEDDSPSEFQAKYRSAVRDVTRATMRANWALKMGIGVRSVDQLSRQMPLNAIDQVYAERANQIWQEMGGAPEARQRAVQLANQEFGLAR